MTKIVKINFSDKSQLDNLDLQIKKAYTENDKVKFVFDLTNLSVADASNITIFIKLIEKYKSEEHKLECIDFVCPKSHTIKRSLLKKCVKMAKVSKPVYLVEKA